MFKFGSTSWDAAGCRCGDDIAFASVTERKFLMRFVTLILKQGYEMQFKINEYLHSVILTLCKELSYLITELTKRMYIKQHSDRPLCEHAGVRILRTKWRDHRTPACSSSQRRHWEADAKFLQQWSNYEISKMSVLRVRLQTPAVREEWRPAFEGVGATVLLLVQTKDVLLQQRTVVVASRAHRNDLRVA